MTIADENSTEKGKSEGSGGTSERAEKSARGTTNGSHKFRKKGDSAVQSGQTGETGQTGDVNKTERITQAKLEPLAVSVDTNLDKAMKILKRKLIKEGLFKELKTRRYYEKPSEKKKRKMKETIKKLRKEEARARKNSLM